MNGQMSIFDFWGKPEKEKSDFPCDGCKHDGKTGCCDYNTADDYCVLGNKENLRKKKSQCVSFLVTVVTKKSCLR